MDDPIRGATIRWRFDDGPTAGTTYEHRFGADGKVTWRDVGERRPHGASPIKERNEAPYKLAQCGEAQWLLSYLAPSGFTLTCVLDFDAGMVLAIASNETVHEIQRGEFQVIPSDAPARPHANRPTSRPSPGNRRQVPGRQAIH